MVCDRLPQQGLVQVRRFVDLVVERRVRFGFVVELIVVGVLVAIGRHGLGLTSARRLWGATVS